MIVSLKSIGTLSELLNKFGTSDTALKELGKSLKLLSVDNIVAASAIQKLTKAQVEQILKGRGLIAQEIEAALATTSFATAQGTATGATVGFSTALKGLGAVIKAHPLMFAASLLLAFLPDIINLVKDLHKSTEELIETGNQAFDLVTEKTEKISKQAKGIDELAKSYANLASGIDKFTNKNISLSDEDYKDYLNISNQLAELFPNLISGTDEYGNYILDLSGNYQTVNEKLKENLQLEKELAAVSAREHGKDIFAGAEASASEVKNKLIPVDKQFDSIEKTIALLNNFNGTLDESSAEYEDFIRTINSLDIDVKPDFTVLPGYYAGGSKKVSLNNVDEIRNAIKLFTSSVRNELNSYQEELRNAWSNLAQTLKTSILDNDIYKILEDEQQIMLQRIIDNLDYTKLDFDSWKEAYSYILENIVDEFSAGGTFSKVQIPFSLSVDFSQNNISVGEYRQKIQEFFNQLEEVANHGDIKEEVVIAVKAVFDFDNIPNPGMIAEKITAKLKSATPEVKSEIENLLNDMTSVQLNDFLSFVNDFDFSNVNSWSDVLSDYNKIQEKTAETAKGLKDIISSFSDAEGNIKSISDALGTFSENGSVSLASLNNLHEKFKDLDSFETFLKVMGDSTSSFEMAQNACNKLAEEYINSIGILDELNESNAGVIETFLTEMGVVNAHEIVQARLNATTLEGVLASKNLTGAKWEEVKTILQESGAAGSAIESLKRLRQEQYNARLASIDFKNANQDVIESLLQQAQAAGVAAKSISAISKLSRLKQYYERGKISDEVYEQQIKKYTAEAQADLSGTSITLPKIDIKLPSSSSSKSSGSSSAKKIEMEFERLYKKHQHLLNMDQEKTADYLKWLDSAYKDAYKQGEIDLDDYHKYEEEVFEKTKSILDELRKEHENAISIDEKLLDKAILDNNQEEVARYTASIVNHYREMQEQLKKQEEYYCSLGYSDTSDEISQLKRLWWDYYDSIKDTATQAWQQIVDNAHDSLDQITGLYDTLKNAAQEFAENGYITVSTFQEIAKLGVENMAYLQDENGLLVINEKNIQKVIAARTQQMAIETSLHYIQQLRQALADNDTAALMRLTTATNTAASSTWDLVYAQLQLLGLNGEQYQNALTRINYLRSLADVAVTSIGKVEGAIEEARREAYDAAKEQADALDDLLKYVEDMIRQEVKDHVDALKKQVSKMKDIVDLQKKSLDLEREKDKYAQNVAEKTQELARLKQALALQELDTSRESAVKQQELREKIADLSKDLADEQADHAYDATKNMLDDMADSYEKEKQKEIDILENSISSEEKVYQLAIERIQTQWKSLYGQLIDWNTEYGNVTNQEITSAWDAASQAVREYGSYLDAVLETQRQIAEYEANRNSYSTETNGGNSSNNSVVGNTGNYDTSGSQSLAEVRSIISEMYRNMNEHGGASSSTSVERKAELSKRNLELGDKLHKYGIMAYRSKDPEDYGTWYTDSTKRELLFEKYKEYIYHTGGIVGDKPTLKQKELFAKLEQGEAVLTEKQQKVVDKALDFSDFIPVPAEETLFGKIGTQLYDRLMGANANFMAAKMEAQIQKEAQQLQNITEQRGDSFNIDVPVQIYPLQKLDESEIRDLTKKISSHTIHELDDVFGLRGKRSFRY